jgi:hypothetical protein
VDPVLEIGQQFELRVAGKFAEKGGVENTDIAVRQPGRPVAMDARALECEVAFGVVGRIGHHHEVHARRGVVHGHRIGARPERGVVEGGPHVARDDGHGPFGQERQRRGDAAGGLQRLRLARPRDAHVPRAPVAERGDERVGKMGDVDHQRGVARARERFDLPHDEGLAAGREQGLGRGIGERPEALAAPRGEDHRGGHQKVYPTAGAWPSSSSSST